MKGAGPAITISAIIFACSCQSFSRYPIDSNPIMEVDTSLFGVWQIEKDSNAKLFVNIETVDHAHFYVDELRLRYGSLKKYLDSSLDGRAEEFKIDTTDILPRLLQLDEKAKEEEPYVYYISYLNPENGDPYYQQYPAYSSIVNNAIFLNISYRHSAGNQEKDLSGTEGSGHFFVRILEHSAEQLMVSVVSDNTLKHINSSFEVRQRITKRFYDPLFYSDTIILNHIHKGSLELPKATDLVKKLL